MKSKLHDACVDLHQMKHQRDKLRRRVMKIFGEDKNVGRQVIRRCDKIALRKKKNQQEKNFIKFERNMRKQQVEDIKEEVPKGVHELLKGVNVFNDDLKPEEPIGPMVCSSSISLTKDELNFLTRGPRFMMREELNIKEFMADVEKMLVKNAYNEIDEEEDEEYEKSEEEDKRLEKAVQKVEAEGRMVYCKETRSFDLGNLRASDY